MVGRREGGVAPVAGVVRAGGADVGAVGALPHDRPGGDLPGAPGVAGGASLVVHGGRVLPCEAAGLSHRGVRVHVAPAEGRVHHSPHGPKGVDVPGCRCFPVVVGAEVVGGAPVERHVEALHLLGRGDAERAAERQRRKEGHGARGGPRTQHQDTHDLHLQLLAAAAVKRAARGAGLRVLGSLQAVRRGKQARHEQRQRAVDQVHRDNVQRVVDLELQHQLAAADVEGAGDDAHHNSGVHVHVGADGGGGHEPGENAVQAWRHVKSLVDDEGQKHGGDAADSRAECGVDGGQGSHVHLAHRFLGGHAVEAVPGGPQDHRAHGGHQGGVAGHGVGGAVRVEAALAGSEPQAPNQRAHAANQVDHPAAGKVQQAVGLREGAVGVGARQPALGAVHPVVGGGVDEAGDAGGVHRVRLEATPLRQRAAHDGGRGGGKGVGVEPERQVGGRHHKVHEEKVRSADKGVAIPVGERIPHRVPHERAQ
mmetsp:Transcript_1888/g.4645  ORF Transcript_1888/g.4645 Transcript_1888/m.4645 type:complete len:480 (-) Transcript_1888:453-1892(-)